MKNLNSWHRPTVEKAKELNREGGAITKCQHYLVISGAWNECLRKLSGTKNNLGHDVCSFNFLQDRTYRIRRAGEREITPALSPPSSKLCIPSYGGYLQAEMSTTDTRHWEIFYLSYQKFKKSLSDTNSCL